MKKQNSGKKEVRISSIERAKEKSINESLKDNEQVINKIENQEVTEDDIYGFCAESAMTDGRKKRKTAKTLTNLIEQYYKDDKKLKVEGAKVKKRLLKKKEKVKNSSGGTRNFNTPQNVDNLLVECGQVEGGNDNKADQSAKDIYTRSDIEEIDSTIVENKMNNARESGLIESETAVVEELNGNDEHEIYRIGVFLGEKFPNQETQTAISPSDIYNTLYEYSVNDKSLDFMLKKDLSISLYDFNRFYRERWVEVSNYADFCENRKGKTLIAASISPFLQDFKEMPNVAFKGNEEIEYDTVSGQPIGELSSSYAKFMEVRHKALMNHAEIIERGSVEKKTGQVVVNQQQNTVNYESYSVDELVELDPRDLEL